MPDIKLRDGSGVETTYNNVDTISVPLADGSGTWKYSSGDFYNDASKRITSNYPSENSEIATVFTRELARQGATLTLQQYGNYMFQSVADPSIDMTSINIELGASATNQAIFGGYVISTMPRLHGKFASDDGQYPWRLYRVKLDEINACLADVEMTPRPNYSYSLYNWYQGFYCCSDFPPKIIRMLERFNFGGTSNGYWDLRQGPLMEKGFHDLPVSTYTSSSNQTWTISSLYYPTLTFETDNGTPKTANWAGKTIQFNGTGLGPSNTANFGVCFGNGSNGTNTTTGIDDRSRPIIREELPKLQSVAVIESAPQTITQDPATFFSAYKDKVIFSIDNYYCYLPSNNYSYQSSIDGTNQHYFTGYSKYNHDKAVETINSLPDCSEYCSSLGKTNTISFNKYLGELTDGGAINNLTDEEIAVAVAKGWTVAFNTSRT